jgi:hypothetical protein
LAKLKRFEIGSNILFGSSVKRYSKAKSRLQTCGIGDVYVTTNRIEIPRFYGPDSAIVIKNVIKKPF